jgi:hypothetical protein
MKLLLYETILPTLQWSPWKPLPLFYALPFI